MGILEFNPDVDYGLLLAVPAIPLTGAGVGWPAISACGGAPAIGPVAIPVWGIGAAAPPPTSARTWRSSLSIWRAFCGRPIGSFARHRSTNRASGAGTADRRRLLAVRPRLARRDALKLPPDGSLEVGSDEVERRFKGERVAGEVGVQLGLELIMMGVPRWYDGGLEVLA